MSASPYDVPYDAHVSPNPRQQQQPSELQRIASPSAASAPAPAQAYPAAAAAAQAGYPAAAAQAAAAIGAGLQQQAYAQQHTGMQQPLPPPNAQPPAQQPPPALAALPLGAVAVNGGILFTSQNIFANSYRVPGPGGVGWIYYDKSMPMPPASPAGPPSLTEQWHSLTKVLKAFLLLLLAYWLLQWIVHWTVALFLPVLALPVYALWRYWRARYQSIELYVLVRLFATAFVPGAMVVMLVESVVTLLFLFLCFQSSLGSVTQTPGSTPAPGESKDPQREAPAGMEFLSEPESPKLFIFLFLLSYVSAGCVEEGLKYWCINRVKRWRPAYKVVSGYGAYAVAAALGFSCVENIGYVLSGALSSGGDSSPLGVLLNALGRTFVSTPLHLLTGYLTGLMVARRDLLGEVDMPLWRVLGWSVFWHGTFDFLLFVLMVLQPHWQNDDTVSYTLMACAVVICFTGLAARIHGVRKQVYTRVDGPQVDEAAAPGGDLEAHPPVDGSGHIAQPDGRVGSNGFSQLQNADEASLDESRV